MAEVKEIVLTEGELDLIRGIDRDMEAMALRRQGALLMAISSRGLKGNWDYRDGKLVLIEAAAPAAPAARSMPPIPDTPKSDAPKSDTRYESSLAAALAARDGEDFERAIRYAAEAMECATDARAHTLAAACHGFLEHAEEALRLSEEAVRRWPNDAGAHHERAFQLLRSRRWQEGWREWEYRNTLASARECMAKSLPGLPEWDGKPLEGAKLLVIGEGGIGDTLQFSRYFQFVREAGGEVLFCGKSVQLAELLRHTGAVWDAVGGDQPIPTVARAWAGLWSLPKLLGIDEPPPPLAIPRTRHVRDTAGKLRVGIHWRGDGSGPAHKWRPSNLDYWIPLSKVPGVELVSLQLGETPRFCASGLDPQCSLVEAAQAVASCDLVIAGDGVVAHLAGSLGVPTWLVLHRYGFWPWERDEFSSWYPDITVFRQAEGGWQDLFDRVAAKLFDRVSAKLKLRALIPGPR